MVKKGTGKKKFYITTPIYYANSDPHIGSAYTTIAADIFARWHKLFGEEVFFLTGTDEHGQKIQKTAEEKGVKPKRFVDRISNKFKKAWKLLNISNDNFIRTTDPKHEEEVKKILQKLYDRGFVYKGRYEAYYCVGCEQYKTKSELEDGKCPFHKTSVEIKSEEAYLFRLSKFQNKLKELIKKDIYQILPKEKKNEVLSFLKTKLQDICISRPKKEVYWGIELPFDKSHTCFVWIDAFWNYLTGLQEKRVFEKFWPADVQLMSKDILRVHATIWPALLLALDIKLPKLLFIHGFFTVNGEKMSKSLGNVIDPVYLTKKYSIDAVRYYIMRGIPFGEDGDFSEEALKERHNNELANKLGNLVSRVAGLCKGEIPKAKFDAEFSKRLKLAEICKHMDELAPDRALSEIFSFVDSCNEYIQEKKPWKLEGEEKAKVLYTAVDSIRIISILIWPFIPKTAEKINKQFGFTSAQIKNPKFGLTKEGKIKEAEILFKKIE